MSPRHYKDPRRRELLEIQLRDLEGLLSDRNPLHDVGIRTCDGTMLEVQPGSLAPGRRSDLELLRNWVRDELEQVT